MSMVPWRVYCAKPYGTLVPEWATTTQCTVDTHTHTHTHHTHNLHTPTLGWVNMYYSFDFSTFLQ